MPRTVFAPADSPEVTGQGAPPHDTPTHEDGPTSTSSCGATGHNGGRARPEVPLFLKEMYRSLDPGKLQLETHNRWGGGQGLLRPGEATA